MSRQGTIQNHPAEAAPSYRSTGSYPFTVCMAAVTVVTVSHQSYCTTSCVESSNSSELHCIQRACVVVVARGHRSSCQVV